MLTGSTPFEGANPFIIMNSRISGDPVAPRSKNPDITPQVEEIILHAMARNPLERYPTALAMKQDLDHPDQVQVTGRADRLVVPNVVSGNWKRYRLVLLCVSLPVIIFAVTYFFSHFQIKAK
jgi:serine/threonine protein kinase